MTLQSSDIAHIVVAMITTLGGVYSATRGGLVRKRKPVSSNHASSTAERSWKVATVVCAVLLIANIVVFAWPFWWSDGTTEIKITVPRSGDVVPHATTVSGDCSRALPTDKYMWVVINPHPSPGQWWPQGGRLTPDVGDSWGVDVRLGREREDAGKEFDIAVILVDEQDDQAYVRYLETGRATGDYPGRQLPASASIMDRITVRRE